MDTVATVPENDASSAPGDPASADRSPSAKFLSLVPHDYSRRHLILSAGREGDAERLMIADRTRPHAVFNVGVLLGRATHCTVEPAESVAAAIDSAYARDEGRNTEPARVIVEGSRDVEADLADAIRETMRESDRDLLHTQGKAPAVRLVDLIVFEALLRSASDIHVQPVRGRTLVRYRLDGVLHTVRELPASIAAAVVSRVKIMARLDVAEQRAPQDGRATVTIGGASGEQSGRRVDLRIGTLPSTYGERVVIRLLDPARSAELLNLAGLGMPPALEQEYLSRLTRTSGIVLSTGPTGSGKTTTLYATLAWISATNAGGLARGCELNMLTVEDPVEYDLSGAGLAVSQTQVDPKKNVTFASGLRHILRQDPDVIMVGEIRDQETARIAVQASLTGHLVLSTLHTNDAASAVARLIDLGVEPFLVASSLSAVLAQRLVRRVHAPCAGRGCAECLSTGYRGRTAVFELLAVNDELREMIGARTPTAPLKAAARRAGMVTLLEEGRRLAIEGITTLDEAVRVIDAVEEDA